VPAARDSKALSVRALDKSFGALHAVREVSFDLAHGEVLGLLGANGAGKSTIVKVLAGLVRPDGGEVAIGGEVHEALTPAAARSLGLAVIHQELALVDSQSVAENIFLGHPRPRRAGVLDWKELALEAQRACAQFGIELDVRRPAGELSTWERWAAVLVRETRLRSRVLILDEPTAAMDDEHVVRVFDAVAAAKTRGTGVVFISHRLSEVLQICDRVHVLRDGATAGEATTAGLTREALVAMIVGGEARSATAAAPAAPKPIRTGGPVLEVAGLQRGPRSRPASFRVSAGEIVGVAGLVGSGRSALLRMLAGAEPVVAGEATVDERKVRFGSVGAAREAGIVFVGEDRLTQGLVDVLPIAANVTLGRRSGTGPLRALVNHRREAATAQSWLRRLRIRGASPNGSITQLSGGNQQKVLFARALQCRPRVLLLDEPTRGVDVASREEIYSIIAGFARDGGAVLTAMSDLDELAGFVNSALVLRDGSLVEVLEGEAVTRSRILEACYGHA
jgi:ABC-type sugar transport system ATPase subunit